MLRVVLVKILFFFGNLYFVLSLCKNILWETSHISYIARRLSPIGSWYLSNFVTTTVPLKNKTKSKTHSKCIELPSLVTVINPFTNNTKFARLIPISFFGRDKDYIRSVPFRNPLLFCHKISEPPLWMLQLHFIFIKNIYFSSILFVNNFPFWFMYFSPGVSTSRQEIFARVTTNKHLTICFAILNTRRKLEPRKLKDLTIGLHLVYICVLWFSFIVDSGSRKWWINQGLSKNLGALYKHPSLACEGDVACERSTYSDNKDRKQSLFNTAKELTFVLFRYSFYRLLLLLLWKGNDQAEDMGRVDTANNRVDKNVRTIVASLLPLCLVMLV